MDEGTERRLENSREAQVRKQLRTPRAAGIAGIVFAALFVAALLLVRPPSGESAASYVQWYTSGARSALILVGLYVIPFAGIAFLWFIGVVRDRVGEREDRLFSSVFLGSGLLFVAMMFGAAASATGLALRSKALGSAGPPSGVALQVTTALTYAFLYVYGARAAGVFMIVTSTIVWRTESEPRWVAVVGFVVSVFLLLSISYFQFIILLFPCWVALVSAFILLHPRDGDAGRTRPGEPTSRSRSTGGSR